MIHSAETHTMIHIARESKNENEPLVTAITRDKTTKGWLARPKEPPTSDITGLLVT
jgi:hypothetical protein